MNNERINLGAGGQREDENAGGGFAGRGVRLGGDDV